MKYVSLRGTRYQFSRRVPDDVGHILGIKHWRMSLRTDSKTEAEILSRAQIVATDKIIGQVRDGTYRQTSNAEIENFAIQWSIEFQPEHREAMAYEMFPDALEELRPLYEGKPASIIPNRKALEAFVQSWARSNSIKIEVGSTDWDALVDACLDEYLTANPEISDGWKDVLSEQGFDFS